MKKFLRRGPILASVYKNLKPNGSGHLVVISAIQNDRVFWHEPAAKNRKDIPQKTSLKKFLAGWKKRIIVISPKP